MAEWENYMDKKDVMENSNKPMDKAMLSVEGKMVKDAAEAENMKPYLDKQLSVIQNIDRNIDHYEEKIKEHEQKKQAELKRMEELLELSPNATHSLENGYTVKPDNRHKIQINDVGKFLAWLKKNKSANEILKFFDSAIKVTALKSFCDKEANEQRNNGVMEPKIDGVDFGEVIYRRYTTSKPKKKKG